MEAKKDFLIDKWLDRFCMPILYEGIRGDLDELYDIESTKIGTTKAKLNYYLRAMGFFRLTFYQNSKKQFSNFEAMWKNNIIITLRNLKKHKAYSFINIFGLAIGMATGFMILQYVFYETTYDQFFENKENIYRVQTDRYENGEIATQWASGAAGAGIELKEEFPEVLDYVKLGGFGQLLIKDENYFDYDYGFFATSNFFQVFSIPLLQGNDSTALDDRNKVVLSKSMAKRIFGDESPMNQEIQTNNGSRFTITGIFKDFPEKSHMNMDVIVSMDTRLSWMGEDSDDGNRTWDWDGWTNYIVLQDGVNPNELTAKFPEFIKRHEAPDESKSEYVADINFVLQPLTDIHLTSHYRAELKETGDKTATYFLLIIGMFVLFIAWVNYINLTTARSLSRAKEVGIRKVLGSYKTQLIRQFLFESTITNILALTISAILVLLLFPYFNDFVGRSVAFTWPDANWFWLGLGTLFFSGILLSGFYPAIVLSGFKPVTVLKGKFSGSAKGNLMRQGLVVFQFVASIVLITGTYIVYQQLGFLKSQDLGMNLEQTLVVESNRHYLDSINTPPFQVLKNVVSSESDVEGFTTSSSVPGGSPGWNAGGIRLIHESEDESNQYRVIQMDDQYIDMFGLEVLAGRGFDDSFGNEISSLLCNETGMRRLGFSDSNDVLNQKVFFWGDTFNVVGVLKDYRQESPKADFDALLYRFAGNRPQNLYSIKVNSNNMRGTVDKLHTHWREVYGERPFDFYFLDDHYNEQYKADIQFGTIFGIFSGLAILVACLGLFGLASYMTSLRMKEVGIRKVLGASFAQLWMLLTSDFVKLVGIAIAISIIPTWFLMNGWLSNFANRIDLSWWLFVLPAIALLIIAIGTISYQTLSTVNTNPAETLSDE